MAADTPLRQPRGTYTLLRRGGGVVLAAALLAASGACRRPTPAEAVSTDAGQPEPGLDASPLPPGEDAATHPPGPPVSLNLPPDVEAALPKTDGGLPVFLQLNAGGANPGLALQIAYDAKLDDPIARWGQCVSRLTACYNANPGAPVSGCIALIELCPDDRGGKGCCPPACIAGFKALRSQGIEETTAIEKSFLEGDCVTGLRAQRDAARAGQ